MKHLLALFLLILCPLSADTPYWVTMWRQAAECMNQNQTEMARDGYLAVIEEVKKLEDPEGILIGLYKELSGVYGCMGDNDNHLKYISLAFQELMKFNKKSMEHPWIYEEKSRYDRDPSTMHTGAPSRGPGGENGCEPPGGRDGPDHRSR